MGTDAFDSIIAPGSIPGKELERTPENDGGSDAVAVSRIGAAGPDGLPSGPSSLPALTAKQTPGGGVESSFLDHSVTSARKATSYWGKEQDDKSGATMRRIRRFYQRFFTGVAVGGRLRFLTLTSSDEAVALGLDIHRSWRCLLGRLRRRLGRFEYIGVREVKGDRQHLHLVFRGSFIDQQLISSMWADIHKSPVVDIRAMDKVAGGARELGKYIGKQIHNRYWQSYGWVFKGWVGWSRHVRQLRGDFPAKSVLVALARLGAIERKLAQDFLCPELPLEFG